MSLRIDTTELISGAYVIGEMGLGVLGSAVPSTGEHGASYLYNDLSLPADNGKEIRGLIVTPPSAGTFFAYEDGSFSLIGAPDGSYTFTYRLFVDGVDLGETTSSVTVGILPDGLYGTAYIASIEVSGSISSSSSLLSGEVSIDSFLPSGYLGFVLSGGGVSVEWVDPPIQGTSSLVRKRGDSYPNLLLVKSKATNSPLNLTGCSFLLTVNPSKYPGDSLGNLFQLVGVLSAPLQGTVSFPVSEEQSNHVGKWYFDVQMTDGAGLVRTVYSGRYVMQQDITK